MKQVPRYGTHTSHEHMSTMSSGAGMVRMSVPRRQKTSWMISLAGRLPSYLSQSSCSCSLPFHSKSDLHRAPVGLPASFKFYPPFSLRPVFLRKPSFPAESWLVSSPKFVLELPYQGSQTNPSILLCNLVHPGRYVYLFF